MSHAEEGQTTPNEDSAEAAADQLPTPGALLGSQRETLEYSLQQVADRLNLTMHFVRSIESDNYEKLPGDVFIRGYLRSYSELLQLDPDYVLELYNHFTQRRQALKQEAIKRISRRRKDKNRPWVLVSGVAFVLLALILWYFNQPADSEVAPQSRLSESAGEPANVTASTGDAEEAIAQSQVQTGQSAPVSAVAADVPLSSENSAPAPALPSTTRSEDAAVGESAAASPAAGIPEEDGNTTIEILETQSLNWPGDDRLDIRFADESWVEITHDNGPEAHEAMAPRGLRLLVSGHGPFTLELGNAEAVTVIYNERTLAFKNAIRDDGSVRLSVGM